MEFQLEVKPPISEEYKRTLRILNSTVNHIGDHYEVDLISKKPASSLPNNRMTALRQLFALEKILLNDLSNAKNYSRILFPFFSFFLSTFICSASLCLTCNLFLYFTWSRREDLC